MRRVPLITKGLPAASPSWPALPLLLLMLRRQGCSGAPTEAMLAKKASLAYRPPCTTLQTISRISVRGVRCCDHLLYA